MAEAKTQVAGTDGPDENGNESSQQSSDESRNDCLYCFCQEVEHGPMMVCDNEQCVWTDGGGAGEMVPPCL